MLTPTEISEKVKTARRAALLSQEALAQKAGVTVRTVWNIESNATLPRLNTLGKIADALEIPRNELVPQEQSA